MKIARDSWTCQWLEGKANSRHLRQLIVLFRHKCRKQLSKPSGPRPRARAPPLPRLIDSIRDDDDRAGRQYNRRAGRAREWRKQRGEFYCCPRGFSDKVIRNARCVRRVEVAVEVERPPATTKHFCLGRARNVSSFSSPQCRLLIAWRRRRQHRNKNGQARARAPESGAVAKVGATK